MAGSRFRVSAKRSAEKEISKLERSLREEVIDVLEELEANPLPAGAIPLRRNNNYARVKFGAGAYRIVYKINRQRGEIQVVRVRPRSTAYKGLPDSPLS